ncbi:serine/threonine-protein kinase [Leptolyngbya ohadii]|uniref:serine/threonine-protein kinase n=1 Tax=Leptolyngbya ohadii TaxID=1962290 RepID=UPI000B598B50|nr:serine/threonine-protein kinase [Leptolyngbya ohadii]
MSLNQSANTLNKRYQILRELGRNWEGGRITYLAQAIDPSEAEPTTDRSPVVLKEFRFAAAENSWSGYKAHEREIEVLQQLNHPRIPRYLDSFETPSGFCLVQQYHDAPSLAERSSFTPEAIKRIAISLLEILVYLQKRTPPIIHRDIKPENILVDKQLNAYLIDFGFARIRGGELALSSVAAGTPGFIPPEEQFGRPLTAASDLYSLGATLICLLTGTRSTEIHKLLDDRYRFNLKQHLPHLNPSFIIWLSKLVEPHPKHRYPDAAAALEALRPIEVRVDRAKRLAENLLLGASSLSLVIGGIVCAYLAFFQPTSPFKPADRPTTIPASKDLQAALIQRLVKNRECRNCNLSSARLANLDLQGVDLTSANLENADLQSVNLQGANLTDTNLKDANLDRANLKDARLVSVDLSSAKLEYANLENVDVRATTLSYARLRGANLKGSKWETANFMYAQMDGINAANAKLKYSSFNNANLSQANLEGVRLVRSSMHSSDLTNVNLTNAGLRSVDLKRSDLQNANLTNATLADVHLGAANLTGANLTGTHLIGVIVPKD